MIDGHDSFWFNEAFILLLSFSVVLHVSQSFLETFRAGVWPRMKRLRNMWPVLGHLLSCFYVYPEIYEAQRNNLCVMYLHYSICLCRKVWLYLLLGAAWFNSEQVWGLHTPHPQRHTITWLLGWWSQCFSWASDQTLTWAVLDSRPGRGGYCSRARFWLGTSWLKIRHRSKSALELPQWKRCHIRDKDIE